MIRLPNSKLPDGIGPVAAALDVKYDKLDSP